MKQLCLAVLLMLLSCLPSPAWALVADDLAFRSGGFGPPGDDWQLNDNGYVGTYIHLDSPGEVTISVQATGQAFGGVNPRMNIVVADTLAPFDVAAGVTNTYEHTFSLPAGTHFVRTEFTNDPGQTSRNLRLIDLNVSGAGTLLNSATNANALDAANTYIEHFRQGPAKVELFGVAPGTPVEVRLKQHDFHFGTAVGNTNTYLGTGTHSANFQQALIDTRINTLVPENAGKWSSNAPFSPNFPPNMGPVDDLLDFAEAHDLNVRMHNLIWGSQQPNWVNDLLNQAEGGSQSAKDELRQRISQRIDYYVGDGDGNPSDGDRSARYYDLDVLNEISHQDSYLNIFGYEGLAEIHSEVADAIAAAGSESRLAANEYNVLQDDYSDFYGNWYREEIEQLNNTIHGPVVSSIGVQSYENNQFGTGGGAHNPSRKMQTLQNLSLLGLPITLTEFGVKDPTSPADSAQMMEETMRIVFGTPNADGFLMWGIYQGDIFRGAAALYDSTWNLTPAGQRWIDLMTADDDGDPTDDWDTQVSTTVDLDGTIDFQGFYGDYELVIDGESYDLRLAKGVENYSLLINLPGDFNDDGVVNQFDLPYWESGLNLNDQGDADGDNDTDGGDFLVWQRYHGSTTADFSPTSASSVAVPEPATLILLLIGALWQSSSRYRA